MAQEYRPRALVLHLHFRARRLLADCLRPHARDQDDQQNRGRLMVGERPARGPPPSTLPLFVAVLLIPAVLGSSQTIFNDGDVSWHIATGQWILDHRAIPHAD